MIFKVVFSGLFLPHLGYHTMLFGFSFAASGILAATPGIEVS
jgi:hypothetical protein